MLRILQETVTAEPYVLVPCGRNAFMNNLVYFERSRLSTFVNIGPHTDAASFGFSHNLWYAHDRPDQSQPSLPAAETNAVVGLDPRFLDAASGDYSVTTNSPAARHGLHLDRVQADLLEHCYANPPTIGAFEAVPPDTPSSSDPGRLFQVSVHLP